MAMETPDHDVTIEGAIDPALPICDAHHHLWERPPERYLLDEFLGDLGSGHNIVSTIAVECGYRYRTAGPDHLKPVGETEFFGGREFGHRRKPTR